MPPRRIPTPPPAPDSTVRRYVADTGLPLEAVVLAFNLEDAPEHPHATERLTDAQRAALADVDDDLDTLGGWVLNLAVQAGGKLKRPPVELLPAAEAAMLEDALRIDALLNDPRAVRINDGAGVDVWSSALVISPTLAALNAKRGAILARCILTPDERRDRITKALTRADGTVAPSPADWCAVRGENLTTFRAALYVEWYEAGRREVERLEAELARERKRKARKGLPDRTVLPQRLVDSGYRGQVGANVARDYELGTLDLFGDTDTKAQTLAVLRSEEVQAPQLAALTPPQVRTLVGVYRLATDGEDGQHLRSGFTVPAAILWRAMGLTGAVRDNERRAHFAALLDVSRKRIKWTATVTLGERGAVMGGECAPFEVRPIWSDGEDGRRTYTPDEAQRIADAWHKLAPGDAWTGPIPDRFLVTIPNDMRAIDRRLVLSGDTVTKLDEGAKVARGPRESFSTLDWVLWMTITQAVQRPHGGRAYVNVAAVLDAVYSPEKVAAQRRKGKLGGRSGYLTQYEKAVAVLDAGGLARRVKRDHTTGKGGRRDVFELLPGNVLTPPPAELPTLPGLGGP